MPSDVPEISTMPSIDRASPIPRYYQLQEILKQEIDDGRWKPGELLPSEQEMSELFGISRTVIRQALDILEGDGQVIRIKGKGTVVAQPKFRFEAIEAAADWSMGEAPAQLLLATVVVNHRVPAGGYIGGLLGLAAGTDVNEIVYVQTVDDVPASLHQMFLSVDATDQLAAGQPEFQVGGADLTSQLRDRFRLNLVESRLTIEATRTNPYEAELLDIDEDMPVFLVGSLEFDAEERPVAFSRTIVRSDHFRFTSVLRRSGESIDPLSYAYTTGANHPTWS